MSYLLILYQGLKPNRFYWEFCNILRKIFIVMVNVFISSNANPAYKVAAAIVLLVGFL